MFNRMVVAMDGSEQSLKAAEKAIMLAKKSAAQVFVVYVIERNISKAEVLETWNSLGITEKRQKKFQHVERSAKKEGIHYEVKLIRGDPALSIVSYAQEIKADLIVIGSRGLNRFQQMVLGSVSHKVVKKATCPVLLIK